MRFFVIGHLRIDQLKGLKCAGSIFLVSILNTEFYFLQAAYSDGAASIQGKMPMAYPSNDGSVDHHPEAPVSFICSSFETEKRMNSGAPMRPVHSEACGEKRGLNGVNPHSWSTPVIVDAQDLACPSKNVRIFSFQRKCGVAGPERTPLRGPASASQEWPGLHFMGSFKKLRTSVLQGIQNRGGVTGDIQEKDLSLTNEESTGFLVTKRNFGRSQTNGKGMPMVTNGLSTTTPLTCVSDEEDDYEEDGYGIQRSSHFSRSIRRAYGAGRISLLDNGRKQAESLTAQEPTSRSRPCSTVEPNVPNVLSDAGGNVKALSRLSKSADNLHVFRSPFKRKVPPTQTQSQEDSSTPNFHRTASASSVDVPECVSGRCRGAIGVRGKMRKLVGSLTDLSVHRKPNPGPTPLAHLSTLSQLHDDYSRRTPCVPASERQRRPPPSYICSSDKQKIQADVQSHTPAIQADSLVPVTISYLNHQGPECSSSTEQASSSHSQLPLSSPTLCSDISVAPLTPVAGKCGTVEKEQNVKTDLVQDEYCTSPGQEQRLDSVKVNLEVRHCHTWC